MKFHKFNLKELISVILVEPEKEHYYWLSFHIDPDLRNRKISKEIIKYVLFSLKGTHHIHWSIGISTFKKSSKELGWKSKGLSDIFEGCNYSIAKNLSIEPCFFPLLNKLVIHKISHKCFKLKNYKSQRDQELVFKRIKACHL